MWIESHQDLRDHPKTKKLCRILRIPKSSAIGHMHMLWWWAMDYAEDGYLGKYEAMDIAIGADWEGDETEFVEALIAVGFLENDNDGLMIHDWHDYAGKLIERRARNAKRMRDARADDDDAHADTNEPRAAHVQGTQRARVQLPYQPNQPTRPDLTNLPDQPTETPPSPSLGEFVESSPQPWDLLEALCEEIGGDPTVLSRVDKGKQLAVAKRLVEGGATTEEIRRVTRWLRGQNWITGGIDLPLIEKQIGKWRLNGSPGPPVPVINGVPDPFNGDGDAALRAYYASGGKELPS